MNPFIEINDDVVVVEMLKNIGAYERITDRAPAQGPLLFEVESSLGVRIFLGRFVDGKSLGWVCYDCPGVRRTDRVVAFIRNLIASTYYSLTQEPQYYLATGRGKW